jgi:cell division protein YceG involved in septum cleavage
MRAAAESLTARGIVGSATLFRIYASWSRNDRAIKPGAYLLRPGASYAAWSRRSSTAAGWCGR